MKYFSTKNDFFAFHIQNTHKSKPGVCTEWHSTKTKGNATLLHQTELIHTPNQLKSTPNQFYTPKKHSISVFFSQKTIFSLFTYKIQHNAYKTKLACARSGTAPKRKEMQHSCLRRSLFTPQTNLKQHQTNSIQPKTLDIRFFLKKRFFRFSHTKYNTMHTRQNSRVHRVAQHQNERKCSIPVSDGACSHAKPT